MSQAPKLLICTTMVKLTHNKSFSRLRERTANLKRSRIGLVILNNRHLPTRERPRRFPLLNSLSHQPFTSKGRFLRQGGKRANPLLSLNVRSATRKLPAHHGLFIYHQQIASKHIQYLIALPSNTHQWSSRTQILGRESPSLRRLTRVTTTDF